MPGRLGGAGGAAGPQRGAGLRRAVRPGAEGRRRPPRRLLPRTISMILVFLPVFFFMVKMYWASTTPPTRAHTLALATAPTLATALLSMAERRGHAESRCEGSGAGSPDG